MRFFAWGAIGAAIYGVVRGMRNGNVKELVKDFPSNLNPTNLQKMIQPLTGMTHPVAGMAMSGVTNNTSIKNQTKKQGV